VERAVLENEAMAMIVGKKGGSLFLTKQKDLLSIF
jgi:hypothetical protein